MFFDTMLLDGYIDASTSYTGGYFYDEEGIQPTLLLNEIEYTNAIFEYSYLTQDVSVAPSSWAGVIPVDWTTKTVLAPNFNGNLFGGSVDFSVETTSEVRIKRRKAGTFAWKTIHIQQIKTADDFAFDFTDLTTAAKVSYEYAYVPLIEGVEGVITPLEITPAFNDYFIIDTGQVFHAVIDSKISITYNQETGMQTTINRKYPFVTKNGSVGYYSGTLNATWIRFEDCVLDIDGGALFRQQLDEFLSNGKVKIIKDWQGNIFMASIVDAIPQDPSDLIVAPTHTINWVEVGDVNSIGDLYDNGYINTEIDR